MQLLPEQFWRLTTHEFDLLHDGYLRREDRAWEKIATLGQWVIAPHTKKKFTAAQLLGRARLVTQPPRPVQEASQAAQEALQEAERARVMAEALKWAEGGDK